MKKAIGIFVSTLLVTSVAVGDIYTDPVGDIATGNPNLDITSFEVTDDGNDLTMTLTVADLNADWGNYMIFMDFPDWNSNYNGSGDNDNPWNRDVGGLSGTDAFIGSWLEGGGGYQYWEYQSGWIDFTPWHQSSGGSMSIDWDNNSITWVYAGLVDDWVMSGVDGVNFEVATSGGNGGDPAIDLLGGEGVQGGWGQGSTSTDWSYYQFSAVPAPSVLALFAMAGIGRRRRS